MHMLQWRLLLAIGVGWRTDFILSFDRSKRIQVPEFSSNAATSNQLLLYFAFTNVISLLNEEKVVKVSF